MSKLLQKQIELGLFLPVLSPALPPRMKCLPFFCGAVLSHAVADVTGCLAVSLPLTCIA